MDRISVLDKGYVRLVNWMGDDTTVVNAARVSFDKQTDELREADKKLIRFLAENDHSSPFRHAVLQFEVYAPLMVARQWWKYRIGSTHLEQPDNDSLEAWNESSRRYITENPTFHIPKANEWRSAPENSKQGSGEVVSWGTGKRLTEKLKRYIEEGERLYKASLAKGIAQEQARLFLPAYGMYVRWYWTASLQGVVHFLKQRLAHDAQYEIQQYAKAVHKLASEKFPVALKELLKEE